MLVLARVFAGLAATTIVALPVASAAVHGLPRGPGGRSRRQTLSEHGTRMLPIGAPLAKVRRLGFIGAVRAGCELASPRPYVAKLRLPLIGTATFDGGKPTSRLRSVSIQAGVITSRGVVLGLSKDFVLRRYPHARIRKSPRGAPIAYKAVVVRRDGKDRMWFLLDRRGLVKSFEIPRPQF